VIDEADWLGPCSGKLILQGGHEVLRSKNANLRGRTAAAAARPILDSLEQYRDGLGVEPAGLLLSDALDEDWLF